MSAQSDTYDGGMSFTQGQFSTGLYWCVTEAESKPQSTPPSCILLLKRLLVRF